MVHVMVALGTRPEIIKMAPVIHEFKKNKVEFTLLHSSQHYDYNMCHRFYQELGLPRPDFSLRLRAESSAAQTALIMTQLDEVMARDEPTLVAVQGDTNTVLAAAITALKHGTPVEHIEAGLRSYDWRMPEEHNRRIVDHASNFLFAPTKRAKRTLLKEKVPGRVHVTGNTVIDAIIQHMPIAERNSSIMNDIKFEQYALATTHRMENVDNPVVLGNLTESFLRSPIPVVFPAHPRTARRAKEYGLWNKLVSSKNVQLIPPQGYFDFLVLMRNCTMIITDSGGIQEEATAPPIRKPVLVTRLNTERPEALESGFAKIVGVDKSGILKGIFQTLEGDLPLGSLSPFGDGLAGRRIAKLTSEFLRGEVCAKAPHLERPQVIMQLTRSDS